MPAQARNLVLAAALTLGAPASAEDITVFAAASLKTALDAVAADWQAETGHGVAISYGGSAALAKQIQQGAPADLFVSAAIDWMDVLAADGLILDGTRRDLLGNRLVLVGRDPVTAQVQIGPDLDLAQMLGDGKLAMGFVDSVPAGQYGRQALVTLGLWDSVAPSVAQSENVRAALALVTAGEAPYGVVYASDAIAAGDDVAVVGTFPADSHARIVYPAALVTGAPSEAAVFLEHLSSDAATAVFEAQGFLVPDR